MNAGLAHDRRVLKRIGHVLLIIVLLATTGTHWAVLQSVAWTNMLVENLETNSLMRAVGRTFDGRHPCNLCKLINRGKQTDKKSELRLEWKKLDFSYAPSTFVFCPPTFSCEQIPAHETAVWLTHAPPVPPPRVVFA